MSSEHKEKEIGRGTYIAIPLPEEYYMSWAWRYMFIIERYNIIEELTRNSYPHTTSYYIGDTDSQTLTRIKSVVAANEHIVLGSQLVPTGLGIIGSHPPHLALAILLQSTPEIRAFRMAMEKSLPEYKARNLPLLPHMTIAELREKESIRSAQELVLKNQLWPSTEGIMVDQVRVYHDIDNFHDYFRD